MRPPLLPARVLLVAAMFVLAVGACGRRGAPEAPLTAAELAARQRGGQTPQAQAAADEDDDEAETVMVPTPTARPRRVRGYVIPQDPFILDPLL